MEKKLGIGGLRPTRIEVRLEGTLVSSDGHVSRVIVKDLSADGFRIEADDQLHTGERILLRVGRGRPVTGQIKWIRGCEAGGIFE